VKNIQYVTR